MLDLFAVDKVRALMEPDFEQLLPLILQLEHGVLSSHLVRLIRHRVQALATCFRLALDLEASSVEIDDTGELVALWTATNEVNIIEFV